MKITEKSLRDHWGKVKSTNICINRGPRRRRQRESMAGKVSEEIIDKSFPNMGKETLTQVEEAQRIPYRINSRRDTAKHILIKLTKIKYKEILKATRKSDK